MKGFVHHNIIKRTRQVMVMSVLEIVIISAGLSLDVFVAVSYTHLDVYKRQVPEN